MVLTYYQVRFLHFKGTLAAWLKGLDKAAFAVASTVGPTLIFALLLVLVAAADSLSILVDPNTGTPKRIFIAFAWQLGTLIWLRLFHEAVFMPKARTFFDGLPLSRIDKLKTDIVLSIQCYSVLWLPIAWVVVATALRGQGASALSAVISIIEFIALGFCFNLVVFRKTLTEGLFAAMALTVFSLSYTLAWAGFLTRFGALALSAATLWKAYNRPKDAATGYVIKSPLADRFAIDSGLLIPLIANELHATLLMRIATIGASLGLCVVLLGIRTSTGSAIGAFVLIAAVATVALYALPELFRSTAISKLNFVAGQQTFRQRLSMAAYSIPTILFAIALLAGYWLADQFTASEFHFALQAATPTRFFIIAYVVGVIASRLHVQGLSWIMPLANVVAAIVLSGLI